MGWEKLGAALQGLRGETAVLKKRYSPNPHRSANYRGMGYGSADTARLLSGWETTSNAIDYYLRQELRELRARSRKMVRSNPYGKRFVSTIKNNVVGPSGVNLQSRITMRDGTLDRLGNDAVEAAFKDWSEFHCDFTGKNTFLELQNLAIANAAQDGEFIFQFIKGKAAGKYGFQLRAIDPELLDVEKNQKTKTGEIRLGVEYDSSDRVVRYHFCRRGFMGDYQHREYYSLPAEEILHGYITDYVDQSRGVPWMHSSLERSKHLEKYDEAAIVNARMGASTMAVLHGDGASEYTGDEMGEGAYEGATLDTYETGTIKDIGNRTITQLDPDYPHQMYDSFVKSQLRGIASGLGVSYHSLSNDLEGVNYSSIRAGVLEDREIFKGLQNWFINSFVAPVYRAWIGSAYLMGAVKIGSTSLSRNLEDYMNPHYQPRRWAWVDPQKDGIANQLALDARLKSQSQIMREQGDDPDSVWLEIARDQQRMESLGIAPAQKTSLEEVTDND